MKNLPTLLLTLLVSGSLWADSTDLKCDEEYEEIFGSIWITINTKAESVVFYDFNNPIEGKDKKLSHFSLTKISWENFEGSGLPERLTLNRKTLVITSSKYKNFKHQCRIVESHKPERLKRLEEIQEGNQL